VTNSSEPWWAHKTRLIAVVLWDCVIKVLHMLDVSYQSVAVCFLCSKYGSQCVTNARVSCTGKKGCQKKICLPSQACCKSMAQKLSTWGPLQATKVWGRQGRSWGFRDWGYSTYGFILGVLPRDASPLPCWWWGNKQLENWAWRGYVRRPAFFFHV
jgi:hypothetical protein